MGGDPVDGRTARRERGREAVVDAAFALLQGGTFPPTAEKVAAEAGVSVASVFRYFGSLEDVQREAQHRFHERYAPLLAVPVDVHRLPRTDRIARLVDARLSLYEQVGRVMQVGRLRSLEYEAAAEGTAATRELLADQVRGWLAPEIAAASPAAGADLAAAVDGATSLDAWDVAARTHQRSRQQVRRAWIRTLAAVCDATVGPSTPEDAP